VPDAAAAAQNGKDTAQETHQDDATNSSIIGG
jgi:hypothetical protein